MKTETSQSIMRSPYTAGPWEAPNNGRDGAVYAPNAPAKTLWRICDGVRGLSDEELNANARLISAAPALLALAQKAHEILAPMADCDPAIREWLAQCQRAADQVDGDDRHWLLPFVIDELADDGSDAVAPRTPEPAAPNEGIEGDDAPDLTADPQEDDADVPDDDDAQIDPAKLRTLNELADATGLEADRLMDLELPIKIDGKSGTARLRDLVKSYQLDGHINQKLATLDTDRKTFESWIRPCSSMRRTRPTRFASTPRNALSTATRPHLGLVSGRACDDRHRTRNQRNGQHGEGSRRSAGCAFRPARSPPETCE